MAKKILIVGGAGFIGSHLADELLASGHHVRLLDSLDPQVHGIGASRPKYLSRDVELIVDDVRNASAVERALAGMDIVFHLAAAVGVGQSMYEISRYTSVNALGTAVLLESALKRPIERLIVASSMSIYGEGLYRNGRNEAVAPAGRILPRLRVRKWELSDESGAALTPIPTPESKLPHPSSIYALLKYNQERTCLCIGEAYGIPTVALRFFNVFGSRQALSNPYTGVMAIFAARLLNDKPPIVYEDGLQLRDFVSVHDVAQACRLAMRTPEAAGGVFNIGSGQACSVKQLARRMAQVLGKQGLRPVATGKYRVGDIRHCFADISRARSVLGYHPRVTLEEGLAELAGWLEGQVALDRIQQASAELSVRGLAV
ncbi:MAG: NAD-dependent epimerase/dehydratase family protein [Candidatus Binataceae bacterium]